MWPPLVGVVGVAARGVVKASKGREDTAGYDNKIPGSESLDLLFKVESISKTPGDKFSSSRGEKYLGMGENSKVARHWRRRRPSKSKPSKREPRPCEQ